MALTQVNAPIRRPEKESIMDKILKGVKITQGLLGAGLAIPKWLNEKDQADRTYELQKGKAQTEFDTTMERANSGGVAGELNPTGSFEKPVKQPFQVDPLAVKVDRPEIGRAGWYVPKTSSSEGADTRFKTHKKWVQDVLDDNRVFVERGDSLIPLSRSEIRPNEDPIESMGEFVNAEENLKKRTSGIRLDIAQLGSDLKLSGTRKGWINNIVEPFDKRLVENNKVLDSSDKVYALLDPEIAGSSVAQFGLGRILAKGVFGESGRLTDQDVLQFVPSSLVGKVEEIKNWLLGNADMTIQPEQREAIRKMMDQMSRAAAIRSAAIRYEKLLALRSQGDLAGTPELQDAENKILIKYPEDKLRRAYDLSRLQESLGLAKPGSNVTFTYLGDNGQRESMTKPWEVLSAARDKMMTDWLEGR
jgi:hypothetical protein